MTVKEKTEIINKFIKEIDKSCQQFYVWVYANNEFVKHQTEWNEIVDSGKLFTTKEFSRVNGCKYKNFWGVTIPTLQHGWILSIARLFDPPYFMGDRTKPRLSVDYISEILADNGLTQLITKIKNSNQKTISSIKKQRNNYLAHNNVGVYDKKIKAGIENLFDGLNSIIKYIKENIPSCSSCNNMIDFEYIEKLSKCGVEEVFEALSKYKFSEDNKINTNK